MPYIEIKTRKVIGLTLAKALLNKGGISAVLTTGRITKEARIFFDQNDVAYAENVPEKEFVESEAQEED